MVNGKGVASAEGASTVVQAMIHLLVALAMLSLLSLAPSEALAAPKVPVIIPFDRIPGPNEHAQEKKHGGEIRYSYQIIPSVAARVPESSKDGLSKNPKVLRLEHDQLFSLLDQQLDNS